MKNHEHREAGEVEKSFVFEYDLADAIYAACLVDSLRSDSSFYFMDSEDGCTSMLAKVEHRR